MNRFAWIAVCAVVGLAPACKKGDESPKNAPSGGKTATPPAQPTPPPEPSGPTAAETLERFNACVAAFNSHEVDKVVGCYSAETVELTALDDLQADKLDARSGAKITEYLKASFAASADQKATPQITLVGPGWVAAVMLGTGTVSGKPVSALYARLVWLDDERRIRRDLRLIDQPTLAHQTGAAKNADAPSAETPREPPVVVVAKPEEAAAAETRVQIVENLQQALATGALDTVGAHLADDVVFRYVPHGEAITGKDNYLSVLAKMGEMFAKTERELVGAMGVGDWVVAHTVVTATPAADLPDLPGSAGKPVAIHRIDFFRFAGTEIAEQWGFENSGQWAAQLSGE